MRYLVLFALLCAGCLPVDGVDSDGDGVPDVSDPCPEDNPDDEDEDGVCASEDRCEGSPDELDADNDGVPNGCDVCEGGDDTVDSDGDEVPDECDVCDGGDDGEDADGDGVPNSCDPCPGDNPDDSDGDGVCDNDDACDGGDDALDDDGDGIPDDCDNCAGDDGTDSDFDGVPDDCDACPNDRYDDFDDDGSCDSDDLCAGFDDTQDADGDGVPNGCDACPGQDDRLDSDGDGVPNGCDGCAQGSDSVDSDRDGVPDGCDACPGFDDREDADDDGIPNGCDTCAGSSADADNDGVPDGCDRCALGPDNLDADADGMPDACDRCPGEDDFVDADADGVPDGCDTCAGNDAIDPDEDGIASDCDECPLVPQGQGVGVQDPSFQSGEGWELLASAYVDGSRTGEDAGVGVLPVLSRAGFFSRQCMPPQSETGPLKIAGSFRYEAAAFFETTARFWAGGAVVSETVITPSWQRSYGCLGASAHDTETVVGIDAFQPDQAVLIDNLELESASGECPTVARSLSSESGSFTRDGSRWSGGPLALGDTAHTLVSVPREGGGIRFSGTGVARVEVEGEVVHLAAGASACLPESAAGRVVPIVVHGGGVVLTALDFVPCGR